MTDDFSQQELVRWLKQVDKRLTGIETTLTENFVSKELYLANRDSDSKTVQSVARVSWWALGLVATLSLGALFAVIGGVS